MSEEEKNPKCIWQSHNGFNNTTLLNYDYLALS